MLTLAHLSTLPRKELGYTALACHSGQLHPTILPMQARLTYCLCTKLPGDPRVPWRSWGMAPHLLTWRSSNNSSESQVFMPSEGLLLTMMMMLPSILARDIVCGTVREGLSERNKHSVKFGRRTIINCFSNRLKGILD